MSDYRKIEELSMVVLRHPVTSDEGDRLPEGRRGTVVHAYRDGRHYEVEFVDPACAVTVDRTDIRPA
jgi:hypothetical protein